MKLLIFTAPSGAGKTTIVKHLLSKRSELAFSVSATTRERRPNEVDGQSYYFLSLEEWKKRIVEDDFLEWEEVYENQYYGTLKSEVDRLLDLGKFVVFDIEVKGARNLKRIYKEQAVTIFVKPPSAEILFERLRNRNTESEDSLRKRISRASFELEYEEHCDIVLLNDDLNVCLQNAEKIVSKIIANAQV